MNGPVRSSRRILLEGALQALPVGVVVHDADGRCILANTAARAGIAELAQDHAGFAQNGVLEGTSALRHAGHDFELHVRALDLDGVDADPMRLTTIIDVTRHHAIERDLIERAYLDGLTGLPNRTLFEQNIAEIIAQSSADQRFALAFLDLDNFKQINDYYSHAAGDALLIKVAERVQSLIGPTDLLARVGGDEFVLLLNPVQSPDVARALVMDVAERLKQPFFLDGHEVFASASIGVSIFPDHGATYEMLRRRADSAMYRVKAEVKGSVSMFEESMAHAATERMAIEQRLRLAIRDRRFCCAFQPKVDLRTAAIQGVEVLLRWRDEEGVIQAPGAFIGLAIELGLINEITLQVLAEIIGGLPEFDAAFGPDVTISINIAAKQASDVGFMSAFCEALARTGCPERFVLELTEEAFFTKNTFQRDVLPKIRAVGAKVSIDDFGVGYSSLAALAEITADELKIDRSFITNIHQRPRSQIVLKAIESLGLALGMTIVAEGIESFEEAAYLQAATKIRYGQGYYYAKPLLLEQFISNLEADAMPRYATA